HTRFSRDWSSDVCSSDLLATAMALEHEQIPEPAARRDEETISALYKAIDVLSPINKAIILLYLEDLSYEEIAQITGLSKSNVSEIGRASCRERVWRRTAA